MKRLLNFLFPNKEKKQFKKDVVNFCEKITKFTNSGYYNKIHIKYIEYPGAEKSKHIFVSMNELIIHDIIKPYLIPVDESIFVYIRFEPENESFYISMTHYITGKFILKFSVLELVTLGVLDVGKLLKYAQAYKSTDDKEKSIELFNAELIGV